MVGRRPYGDVRPMSSSRDQELLTRIGRRVRERRRQKGMSQETLATTAKVRPGTLSRIENGKAEAGVGVLNRVAEALGCSVGDLADPDDRPEPTERDVLSRWRRMDGRGRRAILELMDLLP